MAELEEKEDKNKKKKARKAFLLLLGNLKDKCGSFKKVDEWYSFLKQSVDPLVSQYKNQIPQDFLNKLDEAKKLTDTAQESINKACNNLQWNTEKVIKLLPKESILGKLLLIGTLITTGSVAAAVIYLNVNAVTIVVKNRGCQTIRPVTLIPIQLPGFKLFTNPIPDGGEGIVTIMPLPVTVDASSKKSIYVGLAGITIPFNFAQESAIARSIIFNGEELLGQKKTLNLGSLLKHTLIISC